MKNLKKDQNTCRAMQITWKWIGSTRVYFVGRSSRLLIYYLDWPNINFLNNASFESKKTWSKNLVLYKPRKKIMIFRLYQNFGLRRFLIFIFLIKVLCFSFNFINLVVATNFIIILISMIHIKFLVKSSFVEVFSIEVSKTIIWLKFCINHL